MAIPYFKTRSRSMVLWVGKSIREADKSFLERLNFSIECVPDAEKLSDAQLLGGLAAVVFAQPEENPHSVVTALEKHVIGLLDHDCLVFVLAANKAEDTVNKNLKKIGNTLAVLKVLAYVPTAGSKYMAIDVDEKDTKRLVDVPKPPYVFLYSDSVSVDVIAETLVSHNQQPTPVPEGPKAFKITGPAEKSIKCNHRLMLRRSFHDCTELYLDHLKGGRSGVDVYSAHATLRKNATGRPLPFFVKVGSRAEIIREWENYDNYVRPYVPFDLAPHLVTERCAVGARTGIIVGDYIEDAESLAECARSGRAIAVIGTLFDRTLRGWHRQTKVSHSSLWKVLGNLVGGEIDPTRSEDAMALGAKRTMGQLRAKLQERPEEQMNWGPIHGDLHAENILVRGSDAILIDFLAGRPGLLLGEHAALEVSLAMRVPVGTQDRPFDKEAWERVVRPLYARDTIRGLPAFPDPIEPYAWLKACVRQIRLYALQMQEGRPGQYAEVLAYFLLRAAIQDPKNRDAAEEHRRTVAYCLADELIPR